MVKYFKIFDSDSGKVLSKVYSTYELSDLKPTPGMIHLQKTGLKDSKGVDVFECDVLDCYNEYLELEERLCVQYIDLSGGFGFYERAGRLDSLTQKVIDEFKLKIVGNRLENPELLGLRK